MLNTTTEHRQHTLQQSKTLTKLKTTAALFKIYFMRVLRFLPRGGFRVGPRGHTPKILRLEIDDELIWTFIACWWICMMGATPIHILVSCFALILYSAQVIIVPHRITWSWYTGRWWVGCYIWYRHHPRSWPRLLGCHGSSRLKLCLWYGRSRHSTFHPQPKVLSYWPGACLVSVVPDRQVSSFHHRLYPISTYCP